MLNNTISKTKAVPALCSLISCDRTSTTHAFPKGVADMNADNVLPKKRCYQITSYDFTNLDAQNVKTPADSNRFC